MGVDGYPKVGMYWKQAEGHGRRFAKTGNFQTVNSLVNQVRHGEGDKAAREFTKMISMDYKDKMKG